MNNFFSQSHYSDEQIKFILNLKNETNTWQDVLNSFNSKFKPKIPKTSDAIRKIYYKYNNINFNDDNYIDNAKNVFIMKRSNSKIAKQNKILLENMIDIDDIKDSFEIMLNKIEFKMHKPVKFKKQSEKINRTIVAHLSDTHFGNKISSGEIGGINEYNNVIAARRTALFFKQIVDYKPKYRNHTELILLLNGDLGAGIIHNQENAVDLMTQQFATILSILGQGISYLAQNFKKITIYCTPDNHMRFMHKEDKGRAKVHKWDSFATMAYISLKREFKKYSNVKFVIPESPYAIFDVQGHKAFCTHGDSVFTIGMPSKIIKLGDMAAQINKINNSNLAKNGKMELFFIAHVHTPVISLLDNGTYICVNGCLSGLDAYAQAIGVFGSHPTQLLVEVTKDYVGDFRLVSVKEADNDFSLDKIIKYTENIFE